MSHKEKQELIEKRDQGTLSPEEYQQYINLLETDPSFANEVALANSLEAMFNKEADEELYALVEQHRIDTAVTGRQLGQDHRNRRPFYYAAAAVALIAIALWRWWPTSPETPQLVRNSSLEVYPSDTTFGSGMGFIQGGSPIGELPVRLFRESDPDARITYQYCRDTLNLYFGNLQDTTLLKKGQILYNSKKQQLYFLVPTQKPAPLEECSAIRQPFPLTP